MTDYKHMYNILCSALSQALDTLPINAQTIQTRLILEQALHQAEDVYIETSED